MDDVTPETAKARAVEALLPLSEQRKRLRDELSAVDAALRPLVAEAVRAGVPTRRLTQLTGLAHNTVLQWGRHSE